MASINIATGCDQAYNELTMRPSLRTRQALQELRDKAIKELNEVSGRRPFVLYAKPNHRIDAIKDRLWFYIGWSEGALLKQTLRL